MNRTEKSPTDTLGYLGTFVSRLLSCPARLARLLVSCRVGARMGSGEPLSSLPHLPKGQRARGPAEGRGWAHWTQSFPPAPPTFRIPKAHTPVEPAPTKKTPTVPPIPSYCTPFKESMREEIRRAAGTSKQRNNNGRTFTRVPQPCGPTCVPVCQRATRHTTSLKIKSQSRSRSEVES